MLTIVASARIEPRSLPRDHCQQSLPVLFRNHPEIPDFFLQAFLHRDLPPERRRVERVKRNQPLGIGPPLLDLIPKIFHETRSPGCRWNPKCKQAGQDMPDQALPGGQGLRQNSLRRLRRIL